MFEQFEIAKQAWIQVRIYPLRSTLTSLGIMIAIAGLILIVAVMQGLDAGVNRVLSKLGSDHIMIGRTISKSSHGVVKPISFEDKRAIEQQVKNIGMVVATSRLPSAEIRFENRAASVNLLAASEYHPKLYQQNLVDGRFLSDSDEINHHRVCVISEHIKKILGLPDYPIGSYLTLGTLSLKIVGVMPGNGRGKERVMQIGDIYIPFAIAEEFTRRTSSLELGFRIIDSSQRELVLNQVKDVLRKSQGTGLHESDEFRMEDAAQLRSSTLYLEKMISNVFLAIVAISLIVGGIGVMNMMLTSVTERTREIGILKALGATNGHIRAQFLFEALILSFIGAALGVLFGWGGSFLVVGFIPNAGPPSVPIWAFFSVVIISAFVAIISAAIPAARAAELDPVVALSKE